MTDDLLHLRVVRIVAETADANSYFLETLNKQAVVYRAGQFLTLILMHRDQFVGADGPNEHEVRRSYSLSSAPNEELLRLTIKRVQNGEISRYLHNTLRVGDVLTSLQPAGRFTLDENQIGESTRGESTTPADRPGDVVLIGAGSGITPLFALLKQILRTNATQQVALLYSNSDERSIIFRDELDDLQRQSANRFRLIYLLSNPADNWSGLRGRLNNIMLERMLPQLVATSNPETLRFYICGPGDYMRTVQFTLLFSGFQPDQIRRENFVVEPVFLSPPPAFALDRMVLLQFRGKQIDIQVPAYKSILQAALDAGIALPYSCRGGRCSTCAARCLSGNIHMTINDVLTERDLNNGWVLTCTGYPESDGVVVEIV